MRIERTPRTSRSPHASQTKSGVAHYAKSRTPGSRPLLLMAATDDAPCLAQDVAIPAHSAGCVEYFGFSSTARSRLSKRARAAAIRNSWRCSRHRLSRAGSPQGEPIEHAASAPIRPSCRLLTNGQHRHDRGRKPFPGKSRLARRREAAACRSHCRSQSVSGGVRRDMRRLLCCGRPSTTSCPACPTPSCTAAG
jgi:hypothetical protein